MTSIEKTSSNSGKISALFWIVIAGFFITFAVLSSLYPYFYDDYLHIANIGMRYDVPPTIRGIFQNIVWSYNNWNSRMGEFMLFGVLSLLWYAPWMWGFLNTLAALSLVLAVFAHIHMRLPTPSDRRDVWKMGFLFAALFIFLAYPGETLFWRSGAVNYLWMTGIVLWFLYPYRRVLCAPSSARLQKEKRVPRARAVMQCVLMTLFGVFAGWGNENTSPVIAVVLGSVIVFYTIRMRHGAIPCARAWVYCGYVGFVVGAVMLLSAPGPYARAESMDFWSSTMSNVVNFEYWKELFIRVTAWNLMSEILFTGIAIILLCSVRVWKYADSMRIIIRAAVYFMAGFGAIAIFLSLRPGAYPPRALFGPSVMFLISGALLYKALFYARVVGRFRHVSRACAQVAGWFVVCCAVVVVYAALLPAYAYEYKCGVNNTRAMEEAAQTKAEEAVLDSAAGWGAGPAQSFAGRFNIILLVRDGAADDRNPSRALYYGIPRVRAERLSEIPPYVLRAATFVGSFRRMGKKLYGVFVGL